MTLELVVMGLSMEETISSSVALLFGAGRSREAMPVRLVMSRQIFQIIPKGGGLGGEPTPALKQLVLGN